MNHQQSLSIAQSRPLYINAIFTITAIGLGITVPKIFHLFGLGPAFLPMFLPVILLALFTSYGYVLTAAVVTPLLSYALTGMPPAPVAMHMTVQLAVLGSLVIVFSRNLKLSYFYAIPAAIIAERLLSFVAASLIGSEFMAASAISGSYPGMIMLAVISIVVMKLYER